jgi:hypothetical protein
MMPPHVNGFVPGDGEVHVGNVLTIDGYTLRYADEEPVLIDVESGEAVALTSELEQTRHDRGTGQPGSVQYSGRLTITADGLVSGRQYRLSFLGDSVTFTSA